MEGYEDDDDTHFCIKCHLTVHGLENYVRHRQSGCRPPDEKAEVVRVSPSTPTTVTYPEILNADAFFSSLELRSSSKSNALRTGALLDEARKPKKDDRRKKSNQKSQADGDESTGKEKLHGMLPAVADLDDPTEHLCMPTLVGFPDIVSSSTSGKPTATASPGKLNSSMVHANASIGSTGYPVKHEPENSLESLISGHERSKQADRRRQEDGQRIEQVHRTWLEETMLEDLVENSDNKDMTRYEFEYQPDEESENETLGEDLAIEEDSYSESDEPEDRERPPCGHTGGKWKPDLDDLPQNLSQLNEDDVEADDDPQEHRAHREQRDQRDHREHPPPSYTGGKWKPAESTQKIEEYRGKKSSTGEQPPPGHTRGKWVPGARTDIETGYWCDPCGRKLASRLVYNRHLLSDLHAKRSMGYIDVDIFEPTTRSSRRRAAKESSARSKRLRGTTEVEDTEKKMRQREKGVLLCEMCYARVKRNQMGKHLLSHYHCRVAGKCPRNSRARRFLLENMANVVRQCPFQCSSCHFYCNTEETFLLHWRSDLHAKTLEQIAGSFRCSPCDFWCEDGQTMESHLTSGSHREVVSMMNGSVPTVIGRQRALPCGTCERRFRYNLELRLHTRKTGHEDGPTSSDAYQGRIKCDLCPQIVRSLVALQRHQLSRHVDEDDPRRDSVDAARPTPYFCSFCSLNFATPREAVAHRRTMSHKETVKARKGGDESSRTTVRVCPHCDAGSFGWTEYKEHLLANHAELCHRCPTCGELFALSQDVTRHTREKSCRDDNKLNAVKRADVKERWKCGSCTFSTDLQAELIFHKALHAGPLESHERPDEPGCSKLEPKYSCPVCSKIFVKVSLRKHIRIHTGEKPFPCVKCSASFSRRPDLMMHRRVCLITSSVRPAGSARERNFVCLECNDAFYTKHALRQHMLRHAGKKYKCDHPGCPTALRTASELNTHRAVVHDNTESNRRYQCSDCTYAAKTKTQLRRHCNRHKGPPGIKKPGLLSCPFHGCTYRTKINSHLLRHVRLHTGSRPYKCRHCRYASNNLENLRKHVLSTNLHPGKTIYECDVCEEKNQEPFCTNFAKELRAHLLEAHAHEFPSPDLANDYVLGIFENC